jgi:ankyrin repeat protein
MNSYSSSLPKTLSGRLNNTISNQADNQLETPSTSLPSNEAMSREPPSKVLATDPHIERLLQEETLLQEKLKASVESSKTKAQQLAETIQKRKRKLLKKNMKEIQQNMSSEKLKEDLAAENSSDKNEKSVTANNPELKNEAKVPMQTPPKAPSILTPKGSNSNVSKSLLTPASGGFLRSTCSLFDLMTEANYLQHHKEVANPIDGTASAAIPNPFGSFRLTPPSTGKSSLPSDYYEIIGSHNNNYINNNCSVVHNPSIAGKANASPFVIGRIDEKTFMDADDDDSDEDEEAVPLRRNLSKKSKSLKADLSAVEDEEKNEPKDGILDDVTKEEFSDLPAPHAAAAEGNLNRIRMICALDTALIESLDSVGRQPLFYAVAHSRETVVDYILSLDNAFPMFSHADSFGDTVLHAASAGGSLECVEKLLKFHSAKVDEDPLIYEHLFHSQELTLPEDAKQQLIHDFTHNYVNTKNTTGMTPIHLAGNGLCIEKLIEYGGDVSLIDIHLRTPLFISCAINKESCVEYLIGYLDTSEEALLQKDYRGDTPLHAAACNGSVEALLLLLQCGIDPRICNDQGLKAIDLAIRNKHQKCKDILAEYHLHYCTSSEFDSVLFLATLEVRNMRVSHITQCLHVLFLIPRVTAWSHS